jgi:hypothetical protein
MALLDAYRVFFRRLGFADYPNRLNRNSAVMALMIPDHNMFCRHGLSLILLDYEIGIFLPPWPLSIILDYEL